MLRKALVTGAHGFVGRHIARALSAQGWRVVGIGHGDWEAAEWQAWGMEAWHFCDVTLESLLAHGDRPDAIVHCAGGGSVAYSLTHPYEDFQRSVTSTAAVLEFMRLKAPVARLLLPSSAGVYGVVDRMPIAIDSPLHPISPYGVHKRFAEDLCRSYGRNFGISSAIVRLFSVYGEGLRKQLLWDACSKMRNGESMFAGTGEETRDWIHVEDAADLIVQVIASASPDCPLFNGAGGEAISNRDMLEALAKAMGAALPEFSGTRRPGDPIHYQADITQARAAGWMPRRHWCDEIRAYAAWFKADAQ